MTALPDTAPDPHFDLLDLEIAISQMRTKSTPGPEQIELMMAKKGGHLLLEKLLHLYNTCLDIAKSQLPGFYCPICLLPALDKVLEKLLLN